MSYSTFLESQNKSLRDSLHEWKEKCRQDQVVIKAKDDRIQELELSLTEIATRTRLFQKRGGTVQQVLSAEQMVEIAEKALNPPQQQPPKLPHTNQDQIPPRNPKPRLLDSKTGF